MLSLWGPTILKIQIRIRAPMWKIQALASRPQVLARMVMASSQPQQEQEARLHSQSPRVVPAAHHLIPKSQEYLRNNFCREFLPIVQDTLRLPYQKELVKMLDSYELNEVAWKEKRSRFLFKQHDFSKDSQ